MLDLETRTAILKLRREGHGAKTIARALKISRNAARRVIRSGRAEVCGLARPERLGPHLDRIRALHERCQGNLQRVWEELRAEVKVSYASVIAFCRRHEIGYTPKPPVGHYVFGPGEEMQHDTSPHTIVIGGARTNVECASLILCYSRVLYAQVYRRWNRFTCRAFLTKALKYFGGAAKRCMLDNSTVIIARGTGKNAVPGRTTARAGRWCRRGRGSRGRRRSCARCSGSAARREPSGWRRRPRGRQRRSRSDGRTPASPPPAGATSAGS